MHNRDHARSNKSRRRRIFQTGRHPALLGVLSAFWFIATWFTAQVTAFGWLQGIIGGYWLALMIQSIAVKYEAEVSIGGVKVLKNGQLTQDLEWSQVATTDDLQSFFLHLPTGFCVSIRKSEVAGDLGNLLRSKCD